MELSKLSSKCKKCPYVKDCRSKTMEAFATLTPNLKPDLNADIKQGKSKIITIAAVDYGLDISKEPIFANVSSNMLKELNNYRW